MVNVSIEDFFLPKQVTLEDFYPNGIPPNGVTFGITIDEHMPPVMAGWAIQFLEAESNSASKKAELLRMLRFLDLVLKAVDPEMHSRIQQAK